MLALMYSCYGRALWRVKNTNACAEIRTICPSEQLPPFIL